MSRKPIDHPILDRIAALELVRDRIAVETRILPSRTLIEAAEVVDRLNDRHSGNVVAVFGETVFAANYARMSDINSLDFAVFTFGDRPSLDFPTGVTRIEIDRAIQGVYSDVTRLLDERSEMTGKAFAK